MAIHQRRVADYYDRNTRRFLRLGRGGAQLAIHRSIWAPGVRTRTQAALYINRRIEEHAVAVNAEQLLDLGCGVGGTMIDLATSRPARYAGLTISRAQKQLGDELVLKRGLQEQIRIFEGDFTDPKVFRLFPSQNLIYAVESMIHIPPETNIAPLIAESLVPGGVFILCDDMLTDLEEEMGEKDRALLQEFREQWYAPGIRSSRSWIESFEEAGLEAEKADDFTPWLKIFGPRDLAAAALVPLLRGMRKPWTENLVGGTALQRLIRRGRIRYRFLVFRKP